MCLNLKVPGKSSLRYATKDKICYKVLRIQKDNDVEILHAPYYIEFEYELNKKYNTEMKPRGHILYAKNVSNVWYSDLEFELAQAIDQYYTRMETFRFITCGFHTVNSLKDAIYLKKSLKTIIFVENIEFLSV